MILGNTVESIERQTEKKVAIEQAKNKAIGVLTDLEVERLENEERLQPKRDTIDVMKANIEGLHKLQKKAWSFKLSAFILAVLSCLMTVAGVGQTKSLLAIGEAFTNRTGVFSVTVACLQFVLLNFNAQAFQVRRKHYRSFVGMRFYQMAILSVSVYGNYLYLHSVMPTYIYFSLVLAVSLDLGNVVLSNLANDVKYRIYSEPGEKQGVKSRFEKLMFILSEALFGWIDRVYNSKVGMSEEKTVDQTQKNDIVNQKTMLGEPYLKFYPCEKLY